MITDSAHVGDLAAAFVDEQLDPTRRDAVLVHITACLSCREEVDHQRRLKSRLRALGGPGLPPDLLSRLSAFGDPRSPSGGLPVAPVPAPGPRAPSRGPVRRDPQRALRLLAGAASLVLVGTGTAYAAASDGQPNSPTSPSRSATPAPIAARPLAASPAPGSGSGTGGAMTRPISDPSFATMRTSLRR